jgi:hypothetical protein
LFARLYTSEVVTKIPHATPPSAPYFLTMTFHAPARLPEVPLPWLSTLL